MSFTGVKTPAALHFLVWLELQGTQDFRFQYAFQYYNGNGGLTVIERFPITILF